MGTYTKVSSTAFSELAVEAGVLVNSFSPDAPAAPADSAIICATSGGIQISCVPQTSDWGEDVDNVKNNTKDLLHIDGWDCTISFTALGVTADMLKLALGAAESAKASGKDYYQITANAQPDPTASTGDFGDIWWIGDRSDGGWVACKLSNAFSTGGLSLQTNKNAKGQLAVTLTGFVSLTSPDTVPMEFYVQSGS